MKANVFISHPSRRTLWLSGGILSWALCLCLGMADAGESTETTTAPTPPPFAAPAPDPDADLLGDPFAHPGLDTLEQRFRPPSPKFMKPETRRAMTALLRDGPLDDRVEAAWSLGEAAVAERYAVDEFLRLARETFPPARATAAFALGRMAWSAPPTEADADALLRLLGDALPEVRIEACKAVAVWARALRAARSVPGLTAWGRNGRDVLAPPETPVTPSLVPPTAPSPPDDAALRKELDARAAALAKLLPALPAEDKIPAVRQAVAGAAGLLWMPPREDGKALPGDPFAEPSRALLKTLSDPGAEKDPAVVASAWRAIGNDRRPLPRAAVPELASDGTGPALRENAKAVLDLPLAEGKSPLDDPWLAARHATLSALDGLGAHGSLMDAVVPYAAHPSPVLRTAALQALRRVDAVNDATPYRALAEKSVKAGLADPDETVRAAATAAFASEAADAREKLPTLAGLWRDTSARVRRQASMEITTLLTLNALANPIGRPTTGGESSLRALAETAALTAANGDDTGARIEGLWVLGMMNSANGLEVSPPALARVKQKAGADDPATVREAVLLLWRIGRSGYKDGAPAVRALFDSPSLAVRLQAARAAGLLADAEAIGPIGAKLRKTVPMEGGMMAWGCTGRERALLAWTLGRIDTEDAAKALLSVLAAKAPPAEEPVTAAVIARALLRMKSIPAVADAAPKALSDAAGKLAASGEGDTATVDLLAEAAVAMGAPRPALPPRPKDSTTEDEFFLNAR